MTIYLDYMATTPVDPRVIDKMLQFLGPEGIYGNPSSTTHRFGQMALEAIDKARESFAACIHASSPNELVFTSGATEANNLAILGACRFYKRQGHHLITMETEHKTVIESFRQLEREGFKVTWLKPQSDGLLDLQKLENALTDETVLVSIMHANNEIGVIQDIAAIGERIKGKGILFHVDAAQSLGKLPLNLEKLPVDLMSFSAHKIYGPKGVGALYVRQKPRVRLEPLGFGGLQESGRRPGTLATHQIAGFAEALRLACEGREAEQQRLLALRDTLWKSLRLLPGIKLNGHPDKRLASNLNITIPGIEGPDLLAATAELALSTSSACLSSQSQASYVLKSIGLDEGLAKSSLRISLGRFTTESDITEASAVFMRLKSRLKGEYP